MSRTTVATFWLAFFLAVPALGGSALGQTEAAADPGVMSEATEAPASGGMDPSQLIDTMTSPQRLSSALEIMLLLTVLSLAPAILIMTTCFTRIIIVLALLRQAMATQQLPPAQIITGMALFMTFCIMAPLWSDINTEAIQPYVNPPEGTAAITQMEAWGRAKNHLRRFMTSQIESCGNTEDVYMFVEFSHPSAEVEQKIMDETLQWQDVSMTALIPAFITSELKQAFIMGFYIYLPFLVIDMVIASILMSMGMMMLPPVLISLPFKLLLFVLVDGWHLVIGSLMASFPYS
ncbi:MAG: flagellar type III secretion system pore protein FliP [Sedimentisphaerales bacterium]|nr:flagellar type III secretion system pore protein FliP [Sedimentisphaerales bacterium]